MEQNSVLAVVLSPFLFCILVVTALMWGAGLVACDEPFQYEEPGEEQGPGEAIPEGLLDNWVEYDTTGDQNLDREEYRQAIRDTRLFSKWDVNEDKMLVKEEFAGGMFDMWDADNDGAISLLQYLGAVDAWFEQDTQLGDFTELDADGDGRLTREEFMQNAKVEPVFNRFDNDSDGNIAQNEYGEGLFLTNDANADGVITQSETLF